MAETKFSLFGKTTLASNIIYCAALTVLESFVIYYHHSFVINFNLTPQGEGISISDLIYHGIFILSLVFQVILCVNALTTRNSIQIAALVLFNILSLAYAGVQIYQHIILEEVGTIGAEYIKNDKFATAEDAKNYFVKRMRPIEYIIASIVFVFSMYLGLLSYKLSKEFGWENYKLYTANLKIRNAFVSLTILQTLVKLDIFFIGSYAIQLTPSKLMGYSKSMVETTLIFIIGFIMLVMAWYSVIKELKYVLLVVINLCFLSLAYIVYRIAKIIIPRDVENDPYLFTRKLLIFTLSVCFVLVAATIYYGIICFRNMSRGDYVFSVYGRPGSRITQTFDDQNQNQSKNKRATVVRASTAVSLD